MCGMWTLKARLLGFSPHLSTRSTKTQSRLSYSLEAMRTQGWAHPAAANHHESGLMCPHGATEGTLCSVALYHSSDRCLSMSWTQ